MHSLPLRPTVIAMAARAGSAIFRYSSKDWLAPLPAATTTMIPLFTAVLTLSRIAVFSLGMPRIE